jgi:hypothetical protein
VAALLASQLQPSALDVLHPGRIAVLFEGSERAVSAQSERASALVGGAEADASVWDESRERQGSAGGRVRFTPGDLPNVLVELDDAVVRPAAGVAYTGELSDVPSTEAVERLIAALRTQLDPRGVLAA